MRQIPTLLFVFEQNFAAKLLFAVKWRECNRSGPRYILNANLDQLSLHPSPCGKYVTLPELSSHWLVTPPPRTVHYYLVRYITVVSQSQLI